MKFVSGSSKVTATTAPNLTSEQTFKWIWVDALKGIGIILVVFGHAVRGAYGRDLVAADIFTAIDTRIYSFHMPLFFVVSGLFLRQTLAKKTPQGFIRTLLERIIYPMVLWTYIFLFIKYAAGNFANSPLAISDVFVLPFPGQEHLWFLWALFLGQLTVLIAYLVTARIPPIWFALGLCALSYALNVVPTPVDLVPWIGSAIVNFPFLAFGLLLGTQIRKFVVPIWLGWLCLLCGLGILWTVPEVNFTFTTPLLIISLLCGIALAFQKTSLMRGFAVFGKASMAIYLTHTILSAGTREALLALGSTNVFVHLTLATLVGLLGGYAIYCIARQIGINYWLGFR